MSMIGIGARNRRVENGNDLGRERMDYSYEQLKEDLRIGHEIEFIYLGDKFSITQGHDGWNFMRFHDYDTLQVFQNDEELLSNAKIGSDYLKHLWHRVEVTTVF
jgi:hypothetical protein